MGSSPSQSCRLLALPSEFEDKIVNDIESPLDRIALAATCQVLADRHYLPAVAFKLLDLYALDRIEIEDEEEVIQTYGELHLFCLADAVEGEAGFAPFFISSVDLSSTGITVGMTYPRRLIGGRRLQAG
jgi:hypothetical protein